MQLLRQSGLTALCYVCVLAALSSQAFAQTQDAGGVSFTFGIQQGVYWKDNPDLSIPATGSSFVGNTVLSFGLVSETQTQRIALSADGTLETGNGRENGITLPSVELSYRRAVASAALGITAFLSEDDVSALDFLETTDTLGTPITVSTTGTGTRRQTGATAKFDFGVDDPFGGTLSLRRTDTTYIGTSDPSLIDNTRTTAGLSFRFDVTEVMTATASLSASRLKDDGAPATNSNGVSVALKQARPDGAYTATIAVAHSISGSRQSLRFGRDLDLPTGSLSVDLGIAHTAAGSTLAIGALTLQRDMLHGSLQLGLSREVTSTDSDTETRLSNLSMGYTHEITPTLGLTVSAALRNSHETSTGLETTSTNLSANLQQQLAQDWGLNFGATHRISDKDISGRAKSSSVYLNLSRNFTFRP